MRNRRCFRCRRIRGADRGKLLGYLFDKDIRRLQRIPQHILPCAAEYDKNNVLIHLVKLGVKLFYGRDIHRQSVKFLHRCRYIYRTFIVIRKYKHENQSLLKFCKTLKGKSDKLLSGKRGIKLRNGIFRFCLRIAEDEESIHSFCGCTSRYESSVHGS